MVVPKWMRGSPAPVHNFQQVHTCINKPNSKTVCHACYKTVPQFKLVPYDVLVDKITWETMGHARWGVLLIWGVLTCKILM